ncbi:MAG: UDP-N-acetylmuramoyl-L-alanine--D-glutamate ligase [Candidatus Omnitrophica bacterium]|nr:UDP-N-acetylmuramoyl-L-alanine--D-glutamate ligase [Candidatus Omnitrophota bacterium]
MEDIKDRKVTVIGLGRSGYAATLLLQSRGASVRITEARKEDELRHLARELRRRKCRVEWGGHTKDFLKGSDLVVVSPGVDSRAQCVVWARELGIPVVSEIELASWFCKAPIIAVTGTNGKSTTTTLIGEVVRAKGLTPVVCGNIGVPFSQVVSGVTPEDIVVLEVSSFQLEFIQDFRPWIAVFLNIADDHFDRHKDLSEYLAYKMRIFANQKNTDWAFINSMYQDTVGPFLRTEAQVCYFSQSKRYNENQMAVLGVAQVLGCVPEAVDDIFARFANLPHRIQRVDSVNGVRFVDDSKATNPASTEWALRSMDRSIILLLGGRDKNNDFTVLRRYISEKVKRIILFGEAASKIERALSGASPLYHAHSFKEAVVMGFGFASPGDTVLLSPGCASFDMFIDYAHRGRSFCEIVKEIKEQFHG